MPRPLTLFRFHRFVAKALSLTLLCLTLSVPLCCGSATAKEPTPKKLKTTVVKGVVQDEDGNPIIGAKIWLLPMFPGDDPVAAESKVGGEFKAEVKSAYLGSMSWHSFGMAYKEGLGLGIFNSQAKSVGVTLRPVKPVRIRVLDPSGAAVAGAAVRPAMIISSGAGSEPPEEWRVFVTQLTDESGIVDLSTVVPKDLRSVVVTTREWGAQRVSVRPDPGNQRNKQRVHELRLRHAGTIEGRMVGPTGEPFAGADVFVVGGHLVGGQLDFPGVGELQHVLLHSDANGEFKIGLQAGRYTVLCRDLVDGAAFPMKETVIKKSKSLQVELRAVPVGVVKGRYVTDEGKPITEQPLVFENGMDRRIGYADADGNVKMPLPAGEWKFSAEATKVVVGAMLIPMAPVGYLPKTLKRSVNVVSGEEQKFDDLVAPTGDVFDGTVRGADSSPEGVRIVVASVEGAMHAAHCDATGEFKITVPRGTKPDDVTEWKVDDVPIAVVSMDPLVLEVKKDEEDTDF